MMKTLLFCIENECYATNMGEVFRLTLSGANEKVVLNINEKQMALINARFCRSFYIRCRQEKILQELDASANFSELECVAKKYYLCDTCDFSGINLYGVKRILKVILECLYKYPKLRSKLCYIGTHQGLDRLLVKLQNGQKEVLNEFNLQYICTSENAKALGGIGHNILSELIDNHKSYVATAMCAFGFFDSVLLDQNDYDGYAYLQFVSSLRRDEANGFHPKGCHSPESVVYHELGHLLENMCGLVNSKEFKSYYSGLSVNDIKTGLSIYATTSEKELIAEAFAEYMCNPEPRIIAKTVGDMLEKLYNKL